MKKRIDNPEKFSDFYDRVRTTMLAYALHFTQGNWHKAEDAVQNLSIDIWKAWERGTSIENENAYLWTCVHNYFARRTSVRAMFERSLHQLVGEDSLQHARRYDDEEDRSVEERLERIESYRGKMPDRLIRVAKAIARHPREPNWAAKELGLSLPSFKVACKGLRKWQRDEEVKYRDWTYLFGTILLQVFFSAVSVAARKGRVTITREETRAASSALMLPRNRPNGITIDNLMHAVNLGYPLCTIAAHHSHHMAAREVFMLTQIATYVYKGPQRDDGRNQVVTILDAFCTYCDENQPGLFRALADSLLFVFNEALRLPLESDVRIVD